MAEAQAIRLVLQARHENTVRQTVLHYRPRTAGIWGTSELYDFAEEWWNNVRTALKASVGTTVNFESITVTDLQDDLLPVQAVYQIPQPEPGTVSGDQMPANVAACISWKSFYARRDMRGRTFWYGMNEGSALASIWTAGYLSVLANVANVVAAQHNIPGPVVDLAVYSRKNNIVTIITSYIIDSVVDSQRRRLPGRGI